MSQDDYKYRGARALVALHEQYLREFLECWREADRSQLQLPETSDPNYESRATLLAHVLGCAARYLTWMCDQLEIPAPAIEENPDPDELQRDPEPYLERVLAAWQGPLRSLTEQRASSPVHESRWGVLYCIDAMLEHAVMHPIRHTFQLRELLASR